MRKVNFRWFGQLEIGARVELPFGSFIEKKIFKDTYGSVIHLVVVSNGLLSFSVIPERGMDIGEIYLDNEKISWDRSEAYLLHPDNVTLQEYGGWEKGFYAAVAALGPENFGTPDEIRTVHGTGSYSKAELESIRISWDEEGIYIEGDVPIKGYSATLSYKKNIKVHLKYNSSVIVRTDTTWNMTEERQPLDDGYHIQLAGKFMSNGGNYVLPVLKEKMLLRDSAPTEKNPFEIYDFNWKLAPIRCYQYVPETVYGLEEVIELAGCSDLIKDSEKITAEMLVDSERTAAAFVIRPLKSFPRSLIAKRAITEPMYALEPCKTRPNSLYQKAIDGELTYLEPNDKEISWIIMGALKDKPSILLMENIIKAASK